MECRDGSAEVVAGHPPGLASSEERVESTF